MSKMKELLISGNVQKDFEKLGVEFRETYRGKEYGVCEVTEEEFDTLCNESNTESTWIDCGWRYSEGSNLGEANSERIVKNKKLKCWCEPLGDDELEASLVELGLLDYLDLLEYLAVERNEKDFKSICDYTIDLAKQNNIKLSELFKLYQG